MLGKDTKLLQKQDFFTDPNLYGLRNHGRWGEGVHRVMCFCKVTLITIAVVSKLKVAVTDTLNHFHSSM